MSQELKKYTSVRCINSQDTIKPPDETNDLELYDFYEGKDEISIVTDVMDRLREINSTQIKNGSINAFKINRKYNFNYPGYVICKQFLPSGFSKPEPVAVKNKSRPEFHSGIYFNATVNGGVVCGDMYDTDNINYFNNDATLEMVGGDSNMPHCFKLKEGSFVSAQKFSKLPGIKTYLISFFLKTDSGPYDYSANTLISNVNFIPKKDDGSIFK